MREEAPNGIRLIERRDIIKGVPASWRKQYGSGFYAKDPDKQRIQCELDKLDTATCSAHDIYRIIRNGSWTDNRCNICGGDECDVIAQIGEVPDYEACRVDICLPCLVDLGKWADQAIEARRAVPNGAVHESAVLQDAPKEEPRS